MLSEQQGGDKLSQAAMKAAKQQLTPKESEPEQHNEVPSPPCQAEPSTAKQSTDSQWRRGWDLEEETLGGLSLDFLDAFAAEQRAGDAEKLSVLEAARRHGRRALLLWQELEVLRGE